MQEFEDKKDLAKTSPTIVEAWLKRIDGAGEHELDWRERARKVETLYADQEDPNTTRYRSARFNILWSNTQILKPAIFAGGASPDVRRRFRDKSPEAREAARILERAISYSIDSMDFGDTMGDVEDDYLIVGRGVPRVRYVPIIGRGDPTRRPVREEPIQGPNGMEMGVRMMMDMPNGTSPRVLTPEEAEGILRDDDGLFLEEPGEEELLYEEVAIEYVPWDDVRLSPAKRWEDVNWIAFRTYMTREQLVEQYGKVGKETKLTVISSGYKDKTGDKEDESSPPPDDLFMRAEVWEIWDKDKREMLVISPGLKGRPLIKPTPDPLRLRTFFPIPRPIYSVKTNRTMIPTPEYCLYQDQAEELDKITGRIQRLIDAARAKGVVPQEFADELNRMWRKEEATFLPIENFTQWLEKGGIKGIVDWAPIEEFVKALQILYQERAALIQGIYELTGISDIFRGASDPRETLGAQQLKSQFGSLRLSTRQREFARLVRDCFRLMAEIIAEHFSPETLEAMTGIAPTTEVMELLRSDALRGFRVDVESDSTIAQDEAKEKQEVVEYMGNVVIPAAQAGIVPPKYVQEAFKMSARRFKIARELEDLWPDDEQAPSAPQGPAQPGGTGGTAQEAQAQAQEGAMDAQVESAKIELEAQKGAADVELGREKIALDRERLALEKYKIDAELQMRRLELQIQAAQATAQSAAGDRE